MGTRQPLGCDGRTEAIACGEAHSACLTAAGDVFAWGDNSTGQCGGVGFGGLGVVVPLPTGVPMPRGDSEVPGASASRSLADSTQA